MFNVVNVIRLYSPRNLKAIAALVVKTSEILKLSICGHLIALSTLQKQQGLFEL